MLQAMIPTFSKLADKHFLESVKKCSTQNPNESLNHVIWSLAPKEQFVSSQETSLAISLGVCIFNDGLKYTLKKMFDLCNLSCASSSERIWKSLDEQRLKNGNYKMTIASKERRKQKRRTQCKQQDASSMLRVFNISPMRFMLLLPQRNPLLLNYNRFLKLLRY